MNQQIKSRIEAVINNVNQLPSMPAVIAKLLMLVNKEDFSFKEIADEISKDQAMTTNILKLCNSAYFSKGNIITSVEKGIVTLGLNEVKEIIMIVSAKPLLDKSLLGYEMEKGALWEQGFIVAEVAKKIAELTGRKDVMDIVFTGGIIHNIGKVVVALFVHNTYSDIMELVQKDGISFSKAEHEIMGYSHEEIGEKILTKWNFPEVLKSVVRFYQDPMAAPEEYQYEVSVVHIANVLSLMAGVGMGKDGLYHSIEDSAVAKVSLKPDDMGKLFAIIPDLVSQSRGLAI
jgi:HD-like signal output (HDOD) protein